MTTTAMKPRLASLAPQFLVDELERSIAYYRKLGFTFGEPWEGFYAIGVLDGLELHLKEAPKNQAERQHRRENEHLDAVAGVEGIEVFYEQCIANGATILKPLAATAWGTKDFYIDDPDGYIVCFGGRTMGVALAWDCTKNFLDAKFSDAERHRRRLAKVTQLENSTLPGKNDRQELQAVRLILHHDDDSHQDTPTLDGRGSRGNVNQNVLPRPRSLSTPMRPPWSSTRRLHNASPRPVPS